MSLKKMVLKIALLGDSEVGKTSFILRSCDDKFSDNVCPTIGVDFNTKKMFGNESDTVIEVWDTAGQERYKALSQSMVKKADGIIILYDVTRKKSFQNVTQWIENIHNNSSSKIQMILIGNKCDKSEREVQSNEGQALADQYSLTFYETSCKTGHNIDQSLEFLTRKVLEIKQQNSGIHVSRKAITPNNNSKEKQKECC